MSRVSMPPVSVLLNAIEEAQGELINYIDPNNPKRSAETTIDKLTHILEGQAVLEAMVMLGWTPPWLRPGARKPPAPSA